MISSNLVKVVTLVFIWLCLETCESLNIEDFTEVCMDGLNHKSKPGPEDNLFQMCAPWKNRSCCTGETTKQIHLSDTWLNFDWNHCAWLSHRCREQFIQDLCFYECSPNLGPWLVEVNMKIRNQAQKNVPLCQSVCSNWWNDCKNDLTCLADWSRGFNWSTGINKCPSNSQCKPFHEIYSDANSFCEQVWGRAWKVVPDDEPCMYTWFDAVHGNPNDKVALEKARQLVGGSDVTKLSHMCLLMNLILFWIMWLDLDKH